MTIHTIGHGALDQETFLTLLHDGGVEVVVDVRRFPGSRRHPHFGRDAMRVWLPDGGIAYIWDERLGGRREARPDSPNLGLSEPAFRAYADHMATTEFTRALDDLVALGTRSAAAVMCAERDPSQCHRSLIADACVLLRGVDVEHLLHDGSRLMHEASVTARVVDGRLVYEPEQPTLL